MYLFDLASKLKKLNSRIYIDTRGGTRIAEGWHATGIYYREPGQDRAKYKGAVSHYVNNDAQRLLDAYDKGHKDKYLGGVAIEWVPEYDIFSEVEQGKPLHLVAPGWRSIVARLSRQGYIDLKRAKLLFGAASLGEQSYDKLKFEARRDLAQEEINNGN